MISDHEYLKDINSDIEEMHAMVETVGEIASMP